jgi:hypothetical protein
MNKTSESAADQWLQRIHDALGLHAVQDKYSADGLRYEGVMATGCFPLHDYGAGVVKLRISNPTASQVVVSVTTVDDGGWAGYADEPIDVKGLRKAISNECPKKMPSYDYWVALMERFGVYGDWY